jgi:hypothetical protein
VSADIDPLWKRIWKTTGIRWLGPRGDGHADAMERFQHGFECGFPEAEAQRNKALRIILLLMVAVKGSPIEEPVFNAVRRDLSNLIDDTEGGAK